ncbi:MAG: hypothetical protein CMO82_11095 [Winogradskyella sp.]|nr:hypothetical protein [Winogradskyella sp.]|tara:strand:- start:255 stop:527 length:273 start_codon:yes stop_codon:yes gene_type:complete
MIIQITQRENFLTRFWHWLRGEMQTVSAGEMLHYKGLGNTKRGYKEEGDFLVFVSEDPAGKRKSALCTYQIVAVDGNEAKLELLEYNVIR